MERNSFVFYKSFRECIDELPDDIQLKVYRALSDYALYGKEDSEDPFVKSIMMLIKPQIDANNKRYEGGKKGAAAGAKGGRPKKDDATKTPKKPHQNPSITPNVDVDVDVDVDIYKGDKPPTSSKKFIPPTIEEIKTYCQKRNNGINPNKFHDFYQSKNWMVGKNKMTDWKASVRTWERSDRDGGNRSGTGKENKEIKKHNLSGIIRG